MGSYNSAVTTTAGQSLIARAIAGNLPCTLTSAKTTAYVVPGSTSLASLTSLPDIKQSEAITSASVVSNTQVSASVRFNNTDITLNYMINTIGVYAKVQGDTSETLLAVITAIDPDVMPSYSAASPVAYVYDITLSISNASSVNIVVAPTGSPNYSEFNSVKDEVAAARVGSNGVQYSTLEDRLDTEFTDVKNHLLNRDKVLTWTSNDVDVIIGFPNDRYSPVIKFMNNAGRYNSGMTAVAVQFRASSQDAWTDILRVYANTDDSFSANDRYLIVPTRATQLRIVSHNRDSNSVIARFYYKQNIYDTYYHVYAVSDYEKQGSNVREAAEDYIRVNLKKNTSYRIGIYCERDSFITSQVLTANALILFSRLGKETDRVTVARNRIENPITEMNIIPYRWNYFEVTPTFDVTLLEIYTSSMTNDSQCKTYIAFENMVDMPVGLEESFAITCGKFLHETASKSMQMSPDIGTATQALVKNGDMFILFKSSSDNAIGYAVIIPDTFNIINYDGYVPYTSHMHTEFAHVINADHLKNGNILVASRLDNNERNAYEYNVSTDTIINTFVLPRVDPQNDSHVSQFVIPINGETSAFYIGYCANSATPNVEPMNVYKYEDGSMTLVSTFDYYPKYTQDACVFANKLFIMGNDGYDAVNTDAYITIVNLETWTVEDIITINHIGEAEGIDIVFDGDTIYAYTAGNAGLPYSRVFILS